MLLLALLCVLWAFFPPSASWVETFYARGLYPAIASVVVPLTGWLPFSLSGMLLLLSLVALPVWSVRSWRRRQSARAWLTHSLWRALSVGVILYALFLVMWGANYGRQPVEALFNLSPAPVTESELETLASDMVQLLERDLPAARARDFERAQASLKASLGELVLEVSGVSVTLPSHIKILPAGTLMSSGTAGIAVPWTLEAHIDGGLTEVSQLYVGTHELAHVAGFAGEADADFVAKIAGLQADNAYARYATALGILATVSWQLPRDSYTQLYAGLPPAAQNDLINIREANERYTLPKLQSLSWSLYDRYLVAQGYETGIQEYSRVVTLLAKAQRSGWLE